MKLFKLLIPATVAVFMLGACSKSNTGPTPGSPASPSVMQFQLKAANPLVVVNQPAAPGSILWTSGSAAATEVKLEAKKNGSELEFKSFTLQQIDLFASVIAGMGNISIPAGSYTELEYKITLAQNGAIPAMELKGNYTSGTGVVTPVIFTLNSLFMIKAEQSNVTVTGNNNITALTTLDLSIVSSGITQAMLNSATLTSGKILITSGSNSNLYNMIINNLLKFHHVDVTHH